jgi:hypothetical protein
MALSSPLKARRGARVSFTWSPSREILLGDHLKETCSWTTDRLEEFLRELFSVRRPSEGDIRSFENLERRTRRLRDRGA